MPELTPDDVLAVIRDGVRLMRCITPAAAGGYQLAIADAAQRQYQVPHLPAVTDAVARAVAQAIVAELPTYFASAVSIYLGDGSERFRWGVAAHVPPEQRLRVAIEAAVRNGVQLHGVVLAAADLRDARLRRAALSGAVLRDAQLHAADLRDAQLIDADLSGADLSAARLCGADLRSANLTSANLIGADLHGADLRHANLTSANLIGADLRGADLRHAKLVDAQLQNTGLRGVLLAGDGQSQRIILGPLRSDGCLFILSALHGPGWRVVAGDDNCTVAAARSRWGDPHYRAEPLNRESQAIIAGMLALAKIRGWEVE